MGAVQKAEGDFVYFIDPKDKSDPANLADQKVYIMSYKRLTSDESICDLHGFLRNNAPETVGYAVYKPKV